MSPKEVPLFPSFPVLRRHLCNVSENKIKFVARTLHYVSFHPPKTRNNVLSSEIVKPREGFISFLIFRLRLTTCVDVAHALSPFV